jgi:hypothetical protein
MMKRKLATVLGTAVLGALAFAPAAFAQDAVVIDRSVSSGTTVEPAAPGSRVVVVEPADNLAMSTAPAPFESQIDYGYSAARQPGSVPSPYSDRPASGHIGDEFYYKQFGGVSPE